MKNQVTKLSEADFITSNWSGGTTTELFIYPNNSTYKEKNFKVRFSSATVEQEESVFTRLEGIQRFITPLDSSLQLSHNDGKIIKLEPFEVYRFDGGIFTKSFGKVMDFNLMLAQDIQGELKSLYIPKEEIFKLQIMNGLNILYSFNSEVRIQVKDKETLLSPHELLIIESKALQPIQIYSPKNSHILLSLVSID